MLFCFRECVDSNIGLFRARIISYGPSVMEVDLFEYERRLKLSWSLKDASFVFEESSFKFFRFPVAMAAFESSLVRLRLGGCPAELKNVRWDEFDAKLGSLRKTLEELVSHLIYLS